MKIYLGTPGSENLIINENRITKDSEQEDYEDVETENSKIYRYTTDNTKKVFYFEFTRMTSVNFDVIHAEYIKKTDLNLKIEKTTPNTYDEYTVLFDGPISKTLLHDLSSVRRFMDVSFTLKET